MCFYMILTEKNNGGKKKSNNDALSAFSDGRDQATEGLIDRQTIQPIVLLESCYEDRLSTIASK